MEIICNVFSRQKQKLQGGPWTEVFPSPYESRFSVRQERQCCITRLSARCSEFGQQQSGALQRDILWWLHSFFRLKIPMILGKFHLASPVNSLVGHSPQHGADVCKVSSPQKAPERFRFRKIIVTGLCMSRDEQLP